MKRNLALVCVALFALTAVALSAADLTIDMRVNTVAKDYVNNYLTFKGLVNSVEKDQYVAVDATSGASKLLSTEVFNAYRFDVKGKTTLPGSLRSLLLYAVADDGTRTGDNLTVAKVSGVISVRYVHRGTAYEIVTDKTGKITLPATTVRMRKIGHTDNVIHPDFSSDGKASGVDWKKVWDTSIADGKVVGATTSKTGKVASDVATSQIFVWQGVIQLAFDGKVLKLDASLDALTE